MIEDSSSPCLSDVNDHLRVAAHRTGDGGKVTVETVGAVDQYTAPLLSSCLRAQTRRRGLRELFLDMERVTFLGAAGLFVLAQARRRCLMRGARLVVWCNGRPAVLRPLQLTGMSELLSSGPAAIEARSADVLRGAGPAERAYHEPTSSQTVPG